MFDATPISTVSKPVFYAELAAQARALLAGEHDRIANAANFSALVYQALPDINWAGFYFHDSPLPGRFDDEDRAGMEALCEVFLHSLGSAD